MTKGLSPAMLEALRWVPDDWQKPQYMNIKVSNKRITDPMLNRTFVALHQRNIIEWRGGPCTWEWRRVLVSK